MTGDKLNKTHKLVTKQLIINVLLMYDGIMCGICSFVD